jgi:endonuclease I
MKKQILFISAILMLGLASCEKKSNANDRPAQQGDVIQEEEDKNQGGEKPTAGETKPTEGEDKPVEGEDKPAEGEDKPAEGEDKPAEGEDKPTEGEDKPAEGEDKPAEGEDKPAEGEDKPAEGEDKPTEGEDKPAEGEDKPTEGEDKPAEGEDKPAEGEDKPAEGEDKPTEGEDKPGEGETKPTEGEDKPGEGETKPTEGETKPTEEEKPVELDPKYCYAKLKDNNGENDYYVSIDVNSKTLKDDLNKLINKDIHIYSYNTTNNYLKDIDNYDDHYVECFYTGERMDRDNSGSQAGQWNKEHIFAKSYGFKSQYEVDGTKHYHLAYSDMHHLRIAEAWINQQRSNSYFDYVLDNTNHDSYGNLWTSTTFEPRDEVKGDVARMLFYMDVMYNDNITNEADTTKLNLELTDDVTLIKEGKLGGTNYLGKLSTLLKWAAEDPVDQREVDRNNGIFAKQNNRNPFIDHPEYAYYIYKDKCDSLSLSLQSFEDGGMYVIPNKEKIDLINQKIDKLGEITLDSKEALDLIIDDICAIDQESKSYITGYEAFNKAIYQYNVLKDETNRKTDIDTKIDFLGVTGNSGKAVNNGINVDWTCGSSGAKYGLYSNNNKSVKLECTNLYSSIKTLVITADHNNLDNANYSVEVTDGSKKETFDFTLGAKKKTMDSSINLEGFDLSKTLTITITNTNTKVNKNGNTAMNGSIRVLGITFKVA